MGWIYTIIFGAVSYWYMKKIREETVNEAEDLTGDQKVFVPLLVFMNPIVNGLIFYLGWKKKLPKKAKKANNWALGIFFVFLIGFGIYFWYQMQHGEALQSWRDAMDVADQQSEERIANSEAQLVLQGLRPETIKYYDDNNGSYAGICEALPTMDISLLAIDDSIDPAPILSNAVCSADANSFAVAVSGPTESYCIAGSRENLIPSDVQAGYAVDRASNACVRSATSSQGITQ